MSLLLDALKRAEEAKRQSALGAQPAGGEPAAPTELTLAPQDETSPLPDLNAHLDAVEQDLQAEALANDTKSDAPVAATPRPAPAGAAQAAARNVFAAKAGAPAGARPTTPLLIGAAGGVAALAIAGYFGYQYLQVTGMLPRSEPTQAPRPSVPAPSRTVTAAANEPGRVAEGTASPPQATVAEQAPGAGSDTAHRRAATAPAASLSRPATRPPAATLRRSAAGGEASEPGEPAKAPIRVLSAPPGIDPQLAEAYAALQGGRFEQAEAAYRRLLQRDPGNVDARLGIAAIAAQTGRSELAEAEFLRVLDVEPRNAFAQAGLLSLGGALPPAQRESRLKQLLAAPQGDPVLTGLLQFALGNVYGEQRRWPEAQQAYFAATVADAGNPDYLYNLAVSLEHLQKPALAARHYEAALRAAQGRPAAFDRQQATERMNSLPR